MDVKITKGRFANLIAYDLVKIIISIIAAIMVWVLLFTMCATRATVGEQFGLIVFDGVYYKDNYAEDVILKLKKEKTLDDIQLAFGRGLKDTFGNTVKQIEQIAEEIDKICIIANWEDAVAKYKRRSKKNQTLKKRFQVTICQFL